MLHNISHNLLLLLSYDGTAYHGWQVQPHQPTIEGELELALEKITQSKIKVYGAGRTDSGVHALNQTASFQSNLLLNPYQWVNALNGKLSNDIVVKHVFMVDDHFHARHSAIGKRYRYLILNSSTPSPFAREKSWWVQKPLDLERMNQAASYLTGNHNFSSFRSSQCSSPSPVKSMRSVICRKINHPFGNISIELEANSFLQHMVRIITGTLVDIGLHKKTPDDIPNILSAQNRSISGKTAPACGLYVLEVKYPEGIINWPDEVIDF